MLVAISFRSKPGKEHEFGQLLGDPERGRMLVKAMGATRNALFLNDGRMIRILEFAERVKPVSLGQAAERDPNIKEFLREIAPLIQDGFEADQPGSVEAFSQRCVFKLAYDVRV